jgi:hypothetical protein
MPHRIRLRGPWDVRPAQPDTPAGCMTIPGTLRDGGWPDFRGRIAFLRTFGKPTNLEVHERVWLVFECVRGAATVQLNGEALGELTGEARFDVTDRLAVRNHVVVELEAIDDQCGIVGEVVIEIEASVTA